MNKVQRIREEVEKRYEYWKEKESNSHSIESEIRMSECQHLLLMLDSLQEEPVSNVWHDMSKDAENGRNIIIIDPKDFYGAVLRRGGSQLKNHNKERYVKWAYVDELIEL